MPELRYQLERAIAIKASAETVFRFFTDSAKWADWWGAGSTIDATVGGKVYIRYPNGVEALGEVLEVHPTERIVFTFGYASGNPIPPGSSRVTIRLDADDGGTRLHLLHEFADAAARDEHVQGWRFQLSVFGNIVANEVFADAVKPVDAWFRAWAIADEKSREDSLATIVTSGIRFCDRFSMLAGITDLTAHTGAVQRFMPGIRMERKGDVRHCQGTVLADWVAMGVDGKERMSGTNVFVFDSNGKINSVTGFANRAGA
jgi:uncharacterized protein YndB with AHSA1/START domain